MVESSSILEDMVDQLELQEKIELMAQVKFTFHFILSFIDLIVCLKQAAKKLKLTKKKAGNLKYSIPKLEDAHDGID